jgi:Uncharacterized protein conserved in bacteria
MTPIELYDTTRGSWKLGENRNKAKYAFAIYNGTIQEVYEIKGWFKGGDTLRSFEGYGIEDRWEFVGKLAPQDMRKKYNGKSVANEFPKGSQNPIVYLNI